MRLREHTDELDPDVRRELEAIDRALAGEAVDADLAELATLASDLRDERPRPGTDWGLKLDLVAGEGFRRRQSFKGAKALIERLGTVRPARIVAPAGALATLVVAVVVGVSVLGSDGSGGPVATPPPVPLAAGDQGSSVGVVPSSGVAEAGGGDAASGLPSGSRPQIRQLNDASSLAPSLDAARTDGAAFQNPIPEVSASGESAASADTAVSPGFAPGALGAPSRVARGTAKRQQERDAFLTLAPKPDEVRHVTDQVIAITRAVGGVVVSSQVSEGDQGASAALQLTIPTRSLDTTLDQLTKLANVQSLDEGALDITKPFVSAQERLADARAKRRMLLNALGNATTDAEAAALQQQIDDQRNVISRAESQFQNIARRSRLADVSVNVVGDPNADEDWSLSDAAKDALDVLRTVAGILLVTAAIVVPLGLLLALIWIATARTRSRRRERALDDSHEQTPEAPAPYSE